MSKVADRVMETSTTTGTGTYSLAGAEPGCRTFVAGIGDDKTCYYCATDDVDFEVGIGTVNDATPDTLSRDRILASSNAGAAVDWAAGTRRIFVTIPPQAIEVDPGVAGGRLSVSSSNPTPPSNASDSATLYYLPYRGNKVALYDGTGWRLHTIPDAGVQLDVSALTHSQVYDIFLYDNAGTLTIDAVAWSNHGAGTGARATALTTVAGIQTKTGATSRRYLGTIRTVNSSGTKARDSLHYRFVWNYQNRVPVRDHEKSTSDAWTCASTNGAWGVMDSGGTPAEWKWEFVIGLDDVPNSMLGNVWATFSTTYPSFAWALNGTSPNRDSTTFAVASAGSSSNNNLASVFFGNAQPPIGYGYWQGVESTNGSGGTQGGASGDNTATVGFGVLGIQSGSSYHAER